MTRPYGGPSLWHVAALGAVVLVVVGWRSFQQQMADRASSKYVETAEELDEMSLESEQAGEEMAQQAAEAGQDEPDTPDADAAGDAVDAQAEELQELTDRFRDEDPTFGSFTQMMEEMDTRVRDELAKGLSPPPGAQAERDEQIATETPAPPERPLQDEGEDRLAAEAEPLVPPDEGNKLAEAVEATPAPPEAVALSVPALAEADLSGNLLKNGAFDGLDGWTQAHESSVPDTTTLTTGERYVVWQRSNSRQHSGALGVYQDTYVDTSLARSVLLSMDVLVDGHTLTGTGWWVAQPGAGGEMPVHITVLYEDHAGRTHRWDHGFLIHASAPELLRSDVETGKLEYKPGVTARTSITPAPKAQWCHVSFDLMDDALRRDASGRIPLPPPARVRRVMLYGNGWDFAGAVGNVALRTK